MAHWLKIYMASFIFINDTNGFCSQQNQHSACSFYPEMPRVQVTEFSHHHISSIIAHSHEWAQSDQRAISSLPFFLKSCSWLWPQGRMDVPSPSLHTPLPRLMLPFSRLTKAGSDTEPDLLLAARLSVTQD